MSDWVGALAPSIGWLVAVLGVSVVTFGASSIAWGLWRRTPERVSPVKIEPRLSPVPVRDSGIRAEIAGLFEARRPSDASLTAILDGLIAAGVPAEEAKRRMREVSGVTHIEIPPVSRETLEAMRDTFAPSGRDPDLVVWDAKTEALRLNINAAIEAQAAAEAVREVYDRAMALSARVTPELMALPIPTPVRAVLEELAELHPLAEDRA